MSRLSKAINSVRAFGETPESLILFVNRGKQFVVNIIRLIFRKCKKPDVVASALLKELESIKQ